MDVAAADDPPDLDTFQKVVLAQGTEMGEVMELTVAPDGRVFVITRAGDISVYDPDTGTLEIVMNNPSSASGAAWRTVASASPSTPTSPTTAGCTSTTRRCRPRTTPTGSPA